MGLQFTETYVYHIDFDKWTKFAGLVIKDTPILLTATVESDDNLNLWLDNNESVRKYPGATNTVETTEAKTKSFFMEKGILEKVKVDFDGGSGALSTIMFNRDYLGGSKEDTFGSPTANKWHNIANGFNRGRKFLIRILNATTIRGVGVKWRKIGER